MDTLVAGIAEYRYVILFPLTILEGPVVMMLAGFLLRIGMFDFLPLYAVLMAGDLTADIGWYWVGRQAARPLIKKFGHLLSISEELLNKTEEAFHKHQNKILFLSKITMGFGFALVVLITAGMVRVPFKKYLIFNAVGQFFWTGILIMIGYAFGNVYLVVDEGLRALTLFAFVTIIFGVMYGLSKYLRTKDLQSRL